MIRGQQIAAAGARHSIRALTIAAGLFASLGSAKPSDTSVSELAKTAWQLVGITIMNDQTTTPDDGSKYTITFNVDKRVLIRADCNRGVASWHSVEETDLEIRAVKMTRVKCADGSIHERFVNDLGYVRSYSLDKGHLYLSLVANGGILEFAPQTTK